MKVLSLPAAALVLAAFLSLASAGAEAAGAIGAAALRQRHGALATQLADNPFGGLIHLESHEASRRLEGDVYAVLDHPFTRVRAALEDAGQWCDVMILHLNTKYCRRAEERGATLIDLRVGRKHEQSVQSASLLRFAWQPTVALPDYLRAEMKAPEGPYGTSDYQLLVEAVPLDPGRTFLRLGYAFSYGGASRIAMQLYLATVGRDKVGFTVIAGEGYVGGMRGVVERNTMRYYLAIDAYLDSLQLPPAQQLERRLAAWFDATQKYPRQLHEVDRDDYLRMKRSEVRRQADGR